MASIRALCAFRQTLRAFPAAPSIRRSMATAGRSVSATGILFPDGGAKDKNVPTPPAATPGELDVGELEGAEFKIQPLRRRGEALETMRARLVYQSRKRGTLESDLLLSTFARDHLNDMNAAQLAEYSAFLDENDWDIYYWATQEPMTEKDIAASAAATPAPPPNPRAGEWAQTVGTFKPAYRPVPARWKESETLALLRQHVKDHGMGRGGMGSMPRLEDEKR